MVFVGYGSLKVPKILLGVLKNPRVSHFLKVFASAVDGPLMRWSGGRVRLSFVIPMLLLEVLGARSHTLRRVPLLYADTADGLIVVGSNGGSEREPAWCKNLRANRSVSCLVKGRRERYEVTELHGCVYAAAWKSALSLYPNYAVYQARLSSRTIPLFRLSRVDTPTQQP
ncbi:MAG TPA: nitroreductase family deazaflavin-dependent oxidoreductase [Gammaproteobacteria bacterium]|nr:nitroreductase family deazaflavin-dependent oxidoreductase [Gammaproteobacteria bacterium]